MPADKSWPEARQERPQPPVSEPAPGDSHPLTEHLPNLRNYIASRVRNRQDVDDLLQDTLLRSLAATAARPVDNPLAYSLTVARSVVFDYWNRNRLPAVNLDEVPEESTGPLDEVQIRNQKIELLQRIIEQLPPLRRQVFILRKLHGHSREAIARELNLNPEAVKKHITRATLSIAAEMEKHGYSAGNNDL